jgi:exopolysaccharide biosynthesis operon protein EpsL
MLISRVRPVALLLCSVLAVPASAGPSDALHLYAGTSYGYDDNLLRVPDNAPAFDNTRADSWWEREVGLIFDKTYSRQRISIITKVSKYDFNHFKQLNYDGKDLQGTWFWQLGNHLEGKIGTSYQQVLAPYTDFYSSERNLRRSRSKFAEGSWRFHPSFRVRTAFQRDTFSYELLSERFNNRTEDGSEIEVDYLPRSGSTVGLVARHVKGSYPFSRQFGPNGLSENFTQDELKARVLWIASGHTTIDALVGRTQRSQPAYGAGKTSGLTGRVGVTYKPRGKMVYTATVYRDFAPLESTIVSYTLNKGARVGARWDATAKIRVNADAIYERRNYSSRTGVASFSGLSDSIQTDSLSTTWSPRPTIQVTAGLAHQKRNGSVTLGTGSFTSNSMTLSASGQF